MKLRIPDTLSDAAKKEAALRGVGFSAFACTCLIEEFSKKGVRIDGREHLLLCGCRCLQ